MQTVVVEPRRCPVVPLGTVKQHLRIDDDDTSQDLVIDSYLETAAALIDGPEGWLGRSLGEQLLELRADGFPCAARGVNRGAIAFDAWAFAAKADYAGYGSDLACAASRVVLLDCPPIACVEAIAYRGLDGAVRLLDCEAYRVFDRCLMPVYGTDWPVTACGPGAVRIRYRAGYGIEGATPDLPAPIVSSLLLKTASLYENRESAAAIVDATDERLLTNLRIYQ